MARDGGDRDRRCNADEDQERRHQEAAADPEHAGHKPNRRAHRQDEENIDRNVGDREVELHARLLFVALPQETAGEPLLAWFLLYLPAVESGSRMHLCVRRAGSRAFA
jgi:hypothetical protein